MYEVSLQPPPIAKQTLTDEQARRLLLVAELHWRNHGQSPTWREVRHDAKLSRMQMVRLLRRMRRQGFVEYGDEERSLRVTSSGVRFALGAKR